MWSLVVAARFVLSLACFLLATVGSGVAVLLTVLVLVLDLVVTRHFLRSSSVKRVDVHLPVLFLTDREVGPDPLPVPVHRPVDHQLPTLLQGRRRVVGALQPP
jgi:hypothetical protein